MKAFLKELFTYRKRDWWHIAWVWSMLGGWFFAMKYHDNIYLLQVGMAVSCLSCLIIYPKYLNSPLRK